MSQLFRNRAEAGRDLARLLDKYRGPGTLVLGLPRGGVVVAAAVAQDLGCEQSVIVSRKIGAPDNPEYALGAVAEGGGAVINEPEVAALGLTSVWLEAEIRRQEEEIARRIELYRFGAPLPVIRDRPVIVVDDGVATGLTMLAALRTLRNQGARVVVMATPVIPPMTLDRLRPECDEAIVIVAPEPFYAVGMFYQDFEQVEDDEVIRLLSTRRQCAA
jgi:predicted phosphoribosyltransferase